MKKPSSFLLPREVSQSLTLTKKEFLSPFFFFMLKIGQQLLFLEKCIILKIKISFLVCGAVFSGTFLLFLCVVKKT